MYEPANRSGFNISSILISFSKQKRIYLFMAQELQIIVELELELRALEIPMIQCIYCFNCSHFLCFEGFGLWE